MSVTQFLINSKSVESVFSAFYFNVRSLCVANPHVPAIEGLESVLSKIRKYVCYSYFIFPLCHSLIINKYLFLACKLEISWKTSYANL